MVLFTTLGFNKKFFHKCLLTEICSGAKFCGDVAMLQLRESSCALIFQKLKAIRFYF
jgi:hypothetical protein